MNLGIAGKCAIITGAGRGLGRLIAINVNGGQGKALYQF